MRVGFKPGEIKRISDTMGHRTRSQWSNRQETGTSHTTHTRPRQHDPTYDFPIKRIKRVAFMLFILFLIWALIYGLKVF